MKVSQGDILKIEGVQYPSLIVSKKTFNDAGMVIACPIVKKIDESAVHKKITYMGNACTVLCEQVRYFDIRSRGYGIIGTLSMDDFIDVIDIIQGIIELY
jgi:PemK-like protein.